VAVRERRARVLPAPAKLNLFLHELGAGAPFFCVRRKRRARDIGAVVEAVSLPQTWFVVLSPAIEVSTKVVFAASELTRHSQSAKMAVFSEGYGRNDLQAIAAARFPESGNAGETAGFVARALNRHPLWSFASR
jgi:4-diphosphocytidyl-2C-methyl-D-erythritol kinase